MFCKALFLQLLKVFAICLVITYIPGIPPHASYVQYSVKRPQSLEPALANNRVLDGAEHLFEGKIIGPEAFAVFDGAVYTGVHGGYVIRIDENSLTPIVKFGKRCDDIIEEQACGRPLGMKFDQHGNLYVADAYYGIFKYDVKKGETSHLVRSDEEIEGKKSVFINDVAVAKDGTVYFTVSSTTFHLFDGIHAILAPGDGRVIKYDPVSKISSVLADGLVLPNGIEMSPQDDFLVFSESAGLRVMKVNLKGPKKNTVEVFAESLPGVPDNIRSDGGDGFYVSLVMPADETHPVLPQVLAGFPNIRRFLGRLLYLIELPFVQMDKLFPNYFSKKAAHLIGHFSTTRFMVPQEALVLQLDSKGKIKDALIGKDGSISHVSDMVVLENDILLGSPYNNYIGRVPRPNVPHRVHVKSVRYERATEAEEAVKVSNQAKAKAEEAAKQAEAAKKVEAAKKAEEESRKAEAIKKAEETQKAEARKLEAAKKAEEARKLEAAKKAEEARKLEAAKKIEEARKLEAAKKAEEERMLEAAKKAEEARKLEAAKKAEEARKLEAAKKAEEARKLEAAKKAEEARKLEAAKKAEEARKLEAARKAEEIKKAEAVKKAAEGADGIKKSTRDSSNP